MRIKSFFSDTVAAAIRDARKELGDEAMLLKSRRTPQEQRQLGMYEVVFGVSSGAVEESAASESIWDFPQQALPEFAPDRPRAMPAPDALYRKLIELDFDERLTADFVERVHARLAAEAVKGPGFGVVQGDIVERVVSLEAERFFPRDSGLGVERVIALVGPPGSGKTCAVVRLAVSYGLAYDRPVVLLAARDHRVGADAKIQQFAALLGVDCYAGSDVDDVRKFIESRENNALILIDTPGYAAGEMDQAERLAAFLARRRDIQKHLVLPATMKTDDMQSAIERFEIFETDRLLFTRLDETNRVGPAFSEAAGCRKPISFLTVGQQVPGDMLPASRFSLPALLGNQKQAMLTAA